MNSHGLTRENLVATLPPALQKDPSAVALAEAMADLLARRRSEIEQLRIYPVIDRLDEQLLDILAYDFKVDWWDADYSLWEKRRTLADSWRVHKLLGTKTAVELGLRAIYPHTKVLRWWEYGGEPYHYRLDIDITNDSIDSDKQRRVLRLLEFYRSLRDHNDGVTYFVEAQPAIARTVSTVAALQESAHVPLTLPVPIIKPVAVAHVGVVTGLWESATTQMELPTPIIQSKARARVGVATGLWEDFTASAVLTIPPIQRVVIARARASAGWQEAFVTQVTLPEIEPPVSAAELQVGVASAWQESYTTPAAPLTDNVQTAAAPAQAKSAVVSMQETAQTFINL